MTHPTLKQKLIWFALILYVIAGIGSCVALLVGVELPKLPCKPGETWSVNVLPDVKC